MNKQQIFTMYRAFWILIFTAQTLSGSKDFCQWETFTAACGADEVVVMQKATYGRMKAGKCIERDYGYVGCNADVLVHADTRCSGRRDCSIDIPDKIFDKYNTCPTDLRRYLSAHYTCQKVYMPESGACYSSVRQEVTGPDGFLASIVTEETGCGSTDTPWIIKGQPGQQINLTLHDFALQNASGDVTSGGSGGAGSTSKSHCHVYAILKERAAGKSTTVCGGGGERRKHVYLSASDTVEVRVLPGSPGRSRYFLLEYQMVGCSTPEPIADGFVTRDGNTAVIGCSGASSVTWQVTCVGSTWQGEVGACSVAVQESAVLGRLPFPPTFSIVIIVAVAFAIGLVILLVGLTCLRRIRKRDSACTTLELPQPAYTPYKSHNLPYSGAPQSFYTHNDPPVENDYEYVEDLKLPSNTHPLPPPPLPSHNVPSNNLGSHNVPGNNLASHNVPGNNLGSHNVPAGNFPGHNVPGGKTPSSHNAPASHFNSHNVPNNSHNVPSSGHNVPSIGHNVPNTGTGCSMHHPSPSSPYPHAKSTTMTSGVPPPLPPNRLQGNEYVSDSASTCSPKYFELDANKDLAGNEKRRAEIEKDMNEYTPQRNVQYFGHYSQ